MERAGGGQDDRSALGTGLLQLAVDDRFRRLFYGTPSILDARRDVVSYGVTDEVFAPAGAGDGAGIVVGIGAGPNYRRVADTAGPLVGHAAGGGARRQIAIAVEGHGADSAEVPLPRWRILGALT